MASCEDDDGEEYEALYAHGHWIWDNSRGELKFISDIVTDSVVTTAFMPATIVGPVEFKEDLDVVEQQRFKKRFQRKSTGSMDVVTLQDIKDLVLYSAPAALLSPNLINALHTATTERFLRALILYCQYYLQMVDIMERRSLEVLSKIPTPNSKNIEELYEDNLNDLRLLVAKEYCSMILGSGDFRKFHHMGKDKRLKSMSRKDGFIFEPLIRISVQIAWIALARKNHAQIELEINRLFRSKKFNLVEHNLHLNVEADMSAGERQVLRGKCLGPVRAIKLHSPFFNEIECYRHIDFKMLGLGVVKYNKLDYRLLYLEHFLCKPETKFSDLNISLGIIGLRRDNFDIMLKEIERSPEDEERKVGSTQSSLKMTLSKITTTTFFDNNHLMTLICQFSKQKALICGKRTGKKPQQSHRLMSFFQSLRMSKVSTSSKKSTTSDNFKHKLYPPLYLPDKITEPQPEEFPTENNPRLIINTTQHKKWLARVMKRAARRTP